MATSMLSAKRLLERKDNILDLPDDVLLQIFQGFEPSPTLCAAMEVCTRFAAVAKTPELWKHVRAVDAQTRRIRAEEAQRKYQVINYDEGREAPVEARKKKRRRPRPGKHGVPLAIEVITSRAGACLQTLDLHDCYPGFPRYDHQMTDDDLKIIVERCAESLHDFRVSQSFFLNGSSLVNFTSKCPNLRTLHIIGCRNMSIAHLGSIVNNCPKLGDISVSQCPMFRSTALHTKLLPNRLILERLDVSATSITNLNMAEFMGNFTALKELKADGCVNLHIDGPVYQAPATYTSSLTNLNMDKVLSFSPQWFAFFCTFCPNLRSLSLGMLGFQDSGAMITSVFPPLQYLNLAGHIISDEQWQIIFDHLGPTLVQCDLSRNRILTCKLRVLANQTFAKLEDLNISCTAVTDSIVQQLFGLSPKLKFLDLSGCFRVNRRMRRDPMSFRGLVQSAM